MVPVSVTLSDSDSSWPYIFKSIILKVVQHRAIVTIDNNC